MKHITATAEEKLFDLIGQLSCQFTRILGEARSDDLEEDLRDLVNEHIAFEEDGPKCAIYADSEDDLIDLGHAIVRLGQIPKEDRHRVWDLLYQEIEVVQDPFLDLTRRANEVFMELLDAIRISDGSRYRVALAKLILMSERDGVLVDRRLTRDLVG